MKKTVMTGVLVLAMAASAQQTQSGRETFLKQQAYAEMQRVSSQVDALSDNFESLSQRVAKLERGDDGDTAALKNEVAALRAEVAALKNRLGAMRGEIVSDLTTKIVKIQNEQKPAPVAPPKKTPSYSGPVEEYEVQSGDTLSLIAQAFGTTVAKLQEINNLKTTNLRLGQKLLVPASAAEEKPAKKSSKKGK